MTGEEFRNWRLSIKLSQSDLAKKIGISRRSIVRYESKSFVPKFICYYVFILSMKEICQNIDHLTDFEIKVSLKKIFNEMLKDIDN